MITKLKLMLASTALLIGGAAGFAAAGPGGHGGQFDKKAMMDKFDTNKDGVLDPAERAAMKDAIRAKRAEARQRRLDQFDTNKDGALDPAEKRAMVDQRATDRFAKLDRNGDGVISLDEFKASAEQRSQHRMGHRHHRMGGPGWRGRGGNSGGNTGNPSQL